MGMLVLRRRHGEEIRIPAAGVKVKLLSHKRCKLGVTAPMGVKILRGEHDGGLEPEDPIGRLLASALGILERLDPDGDNPPDESEYRQVVAALRAAVRPYAPAIAEVGHA